MRTPARSRTILAGIMAALLAFASGCVNSYDHQPDTAYYVAPPPPAPQEQQANAGEGSLAAAAPGQEVVVGSDAAYADTDPAALADFREPLAPYGTWIDDPTYGTVWVPREDVVGADFVPYQTAGHWAYDDDYVWVSDYSWGWAPFHYGRWVSMQNRGWAWIPGRTYSGAWVVWRTGPAGYGYVGWAPMAPSWYWFNGFAYGLSVALWYQPHYAYCHRDNLFSRHVSSHVVRGRDAQVHDARTTTYTPARPAADGRTAANPSVDARSSAKPSVDPRTGASPSVDPVPGAAAGGANAAARGPAPKSLGIDETRIARVNPAETPGIAKAREFAAPHTAVKIGGSAPATTASLGTAKAERSSASAPATSIGARPPGLADVPVAMAPRYVPRPAPPAANQAVAGSAAVRSQPSAPAAATPRGPLAAPTQLPSSVATAPRTLGVEPRSIPQSAAAPSAPRLSAPRLAAPSGPSPAEFAARAGQPRSAPSMAAQAPSYSPPSSSTFRSAAPAPARSYSAPSRPAAPSFRAPSRAAAPSYSAPSRSYGSASPSRSYSAPSRSYSAPSRSYGSASPSRSYSTPSRSASPSRSFSAPSRAASPSRSFSAPSRASSPSRSSAPSRSFSSSRGRR